MATVTARIEDIDRRAVNKPPGSKGWLFVVALSLNPPADF
jgi:hypothetical protein